MALSSNLNASGNHLEFIRCWSCCPLGIHTNHLTLLCTRRSHSGLAHINSLWFKIFFTRKPWLEWHLYCVKSWFSCPYVMYMGLHTMKCTHRNHSCWLTLIHCNSRCFLTMNHDRNDICIASRDGLLVLMLSIRVFTQWNVLWGTIHVESPWFMVIQEVLRLQKHFSSL